MNLPKIAPGGLWQCFIYSQDTLLLKGLCAYFYVNTDSRYRLVTIFNILAHKRTVSVLVSVCTDQLTVHCLSTEDTGNMEPPID